MKKICLIQVWFGELPFYFEDHLKTCNDQKNVDFLFFTDQIHDQRLKFASANIKIKYLTPEIYENLFYKKIGFQIKLQNFRKLCDHKVLYSHLFDSFLQQYDYVGAYDIDIFWGDIYNLLKNHLNEELISIGDDKYYPGIRGPFFIWKNNGIYNKYYTQIENIRDLLQSFEYQSLDETFLIKIFENNNVKIFNLSSLINFNYENGTYLENGKIINKKLFIDNNEKLLSHFYYKNDFKTKTIDNDIYFYSKKQLKEDFYWITFFNKNYEKLAIEMLNSINNFSNRKVIIYSVDYEFNIDDLDLNKEQFKVIKFDFAGEKNPDLMKNIKSYVLKDSCEQFKNKNLVYIDTDLYLTANCDSVIKYFNQLKNYPLLNLNVYDVIFINNFKNTGKEISPLWILGDTIGVNNYVYPRRKSNFIVYNSNSLSFFSEAVELYEKYKNTKDGIFGIYDEDALNILLAKYNYTNSLPTIDIEETDDIENLNILKNYKYGITEISSQARLPKHTNEILCFHKMKTLEEFNSIKNNYLNKIICQNEISCFYLKSKNKILFQKKNFFTKKTFSAKVKFEIFNQKDSSIIFSFRNAEIYNFFTFYIDEICLTDSDYYVIISEEQSDNVLYSNFLTILE